MILAGAMVRCAVAAIESPAPDGSVERLPEYRVKGDPFEEFGFRVSPGFDIERSHGSAKAYTPVVDLVLPNTAAAKAGIRPGDRIIAADGVRTSTTSNSLKAWRSLQRDKWKKIEAGETGVTWTLVVENMATLAQRRVVLRLPTAPPIWGVTAWRQPEDRKPVHLGEDGPLSERAEQILNNGIWMMLRGIYQKGFELPLDATHPHFLCYQWTLWADGVGHRMYVSQQSGQTDIILEVIYGTNAGLGGLFDSGVPTAVPDHSLGPAMTVQASASCAYLTSSSAQLRSAWRLTQFGKQQALPASAARDGFEGEVQFWLTRVEKGSKLWPIELTLGTGTKNGAREVLPSSS